MPGESNGGTRTASSIVELLRADDAQVTALCERFAAAEKNDSPRVVRDRLIGQVCESLSIQRLAEEEVLYPALGAEDNKLVFAFQLAGLGISMRIAEIRDAAKTREQRDLAALRLMDMVRRNMLERAQVLLPFVKARISATQLRWMGDDYEQRKAALWRTDENAGAPRAVREDESLAVTPIVLHRDAGRPGADEARLQ